MGKASKVAIVLPLSLATAFSPRGPVDHCSPGHFSSQEKVDPRSLPTCSPSADASRLPATMLSSPVVSTISEEWNPNENATESSLEVTQRFNSKRNGYFLGLPIEKDSDLVVDQEILAAVLKEPVVEVIAVSLVTLSSLLVAFSTMNNIDLKTVANTIRAENVIACVFAFEFFARWYSQFTWKGMLDYLFKPLVVVDLVVVILPLIPLLVPPASAGVYDILPSWLFSSAGLVNLRLLRVLRIQRVLTDMDTFADFEMALGIPRTEVKPYQLELARVVLSIFTLLSISTGLIYSAENTVNPNIPNYFEALYFTLTTLTTVGFGDITPQTPEGKLVVSGSILAGVAVIPAQAAALVEALLQREEYRAGEAQQQQRKSKRKSSDERKNMIMQAAACPNCDARFHWRQAEYCWSCGTKLDNDSRL